MKRKQKNNKSAQTILEYAIFITVVLIALSAVAVKIRQKTEATYKESADTFGEGRQYGALTTTGGVVPVEFPILPEPAPPGVVVPPTLEPNEDCDLTLLASLRDDVVNKMDYAQQLAKETSDARKVEAEAKEKAEAAREAARIKREEAVTARGAATVARRSANDAWGRWSRWTTRCNDCKAFWGEAYPGCVPTCNNVTAWLIEANARETTARWLESEATRLEREATRLERLVPPLDAEAKRLEDITKAKEAAYLKAGEDVGIASDELERATAECYS